MSPIVCRPRSKSLFFAVTLSRFLVRQLPAPLLQLIEVFDALAIIGLEAGL